MGNVVVLLQLYTDDLEGMQKMINQIQKELLIKFQKQATEKLNVLC